MLDDSHDLPELAPNAKPVSQRRYRPAYEVAAIRAALKAEALAEKILDQALDPGDEYKPSDRLAATKLLFDMEHRVRQERRDEEDHVARLQGDDLDQALRSRIAEILGADVDGEIYDADVEEDQYQ